MSIIGVCGHYKTGSSTVIELLKEFDDVNVLYGEKEFVVTYFPDGLEDLEYHLRYFRKNHSSVAIKRFRRFLNMPFYKKHFKKKINAAADIYLNKLAEYSSYKLFCTTDYYFRSKPALFIRKVIINVFEMLRNPLLLKLINNRFFCFKKEFSVMPECLDAASKDFISDILSMIGYNSDKVSVLNQPFNSRTPTDSFKYFENPKAILVDRDPRDHYILLKAILRPLGREGGAPLDKVEDYIVYYKQSRKSILDLKEHTDVMIMNYEELIHDYENVVQRISNFCEISSHTNKGKYFNPAHAYDRTQLYKKYKGYEDDIAKIEKELPEYLFPFENWIVNS